MAWLNARSTRRRPLAEGRPRLAARDQVLEQEHEQGDAEDDDERLKTRRIEVARHGWFRRPPGPPPAARGGRRRTARSHFVKYQVSGLIVEQRVLRDTRPARFFCASVSANAWFGCQTTGRSVVR